MYGHRGSFWNLLASLRDRKQSPRKVWWNHARYLQRGSVRLCFDVRRKVEASAPSTGALAILFLRQVDHLRTNTRINLLSAVRCSIVSEPISLDMVSELVFARGYNLWMCHRSQREFLAVQQESDVLRYHGLLLNPEVSVCSKISPTNSHMLMLTRMSRQKPCISHI